MESGQSTSRGGGTFGPAYDAKIDGKRLRRQQEIIRDVMLSAGECNTWLTLPEIAKITAYREASISAQLRHLRKKVFGGFTVEKRRRGKESRGLWEYRVKRPGQVIPEQLELLRPA